MTYLQTLDVVEYFLDSPSLLLVLGQSWNCDASGRSVQHVEILSKFKVRLFPLFSLNVLDEAREVVENCRVPGFNLDLKFNGE